MNYPNHTPKPQAPCKACGTVFKPTPGQQIQLYCNVCHMRLRDPRKWALELKRENIELRQQLAERNSEALREYQIAKIFTTTTSEAETGADNPGKMNDERNVV